MWRGWHFSRMATKVRRCEVVLHVGLTSLQAQEYRNNYAWYSAGGREMVVYHVK